MPTGNDLTGIFEGSLSHNAVAGPFPFSSFSISSPPTIFFSLFYSHYRPFAYLSWLLGLCFDGFLECVDEWICVYIRFLYLLPGAFASVCFFLLCVCFTLCYFIIIPLMPVCFPMRDRMRIDQDGRGERRKWGM